MDIFIDNLQKNQVLDLSALRQVARRILEFRKCPDRCELSIVLVDDQEIRRLNREYRGIDRSTDVLSFAQQENIDPQLVQPHSEDAAFPLVLGDVILSIETAQKQAQERRKSFEAELYFLLIHGILHLLGYDHQTDDDAHVMKQLEQDVLRELERI
jgi:probable rRNA maturation factor